jgi:AMP deaminase
MCFCVFLLLQGLNVSLSTDDPLMLHYTNDALLEEYSVAAQVQPTKLCRISQLLLR